MDTDAAGGGGKQGEGNISLVFLFISVAKVTPGARQVSASSPSRVIDPWEK